MLKDVRNSLDQGHCVLSIDDYRFPHRIKEETWRVVFNRNKINKVIETILINKNTKRLYDLVMGFDRSPDLLQLVDLIGGKCELIQHIQHCGNLLSADPIFTLRDAGCLTPVNFRQIKYFSWNDLGVLPEVLKKLHEKKLLTQRNFELLMQQKKNVASIEKGLACLIFSHDINQRYFEWIVKSGENAESLGSKITTLHEFNLHNALNLQAVVKTAYSLGNLKTPFSSLQVSGSFRKEHSEALFWKNPPELQTLIQRLDEMIAYGIELILFDETKGKTTLMLGLDLKKDLKFFFESSPEACVKNNANFKAAFLQKLHSKDAEMAEHRTQWGKIVANVAIAFTGIGLIVLGVQYALKREVFFASTQRQKLVAQVEQAEWLAAPGT
jgi:hypothetical protein